MSRDWLSGVLRRTTPRPGSRVACPARTGRDVLSGVTSVRLRGSSGGMRPIASGEEPGQGTLAHRARPTTRFRPGFGAPASQPSPAPLPSAPHRQDLPSTTALGCSELAPLMPRLPRELGGGITRDLGSLVEGGSVERLTRQPGEAGQVFHVKRCGTGKTLEFQTRAAPPLPLPGRPPSHNLVHQALEVARRYPGDAAGLTEGGGLRDLEFLPSLERE